MLVMSTQLEWRPIDTFGSRLVLIRRELGLSTEEIADRCGLKHQTWSTWERGATPRGMNAVVAKIALATGVNRDWLMWGGPLGEAESLATLDRPTGGPGVAPGQPTISDKDTELMQYRSLRRVTPSQNLVKRNNRRLKEAA